MPPTKQDIISRVYNSIMCLLHNSFLFESALWAKNGFFPGYGTEYTKSDTFTIGIRIEQDKETMKTLQSLCVNMPFINRWLFHFMLNKDLSMISRHSFT